MFLSLRRRKQRRAFSEGMRNLAFNLLMSVFRRRLEVELLFFFFFTFCSRHTWVFFGEGSQDGSRSLETERSLS